MKYLLLLLSILSFSCKSKNSDYDASGVFEAVETIVPAEANGIIQSLTLQEGDSLVAGQVIGYIDSAQLFLKKLQVEAQIRALLARKPDISAQTNAFNKQLAVAQTRLNAQQVEKRRIENLLRADAATPKQLDAVTSEVAALEKELQVIHGQEAAQASQLHTQSNGLDAEARALHAQVDQLEDQLHHTRIINPSTGTVINSYAEPGEMAVIGKTLYKIADLRSLILRVYVTEGQLAGIHLKQQVQVFPGGANNKSSYTGTVEWVSSKAEFTPKTIQTKDERTNLVYAVKLRVRNDGNLRIGMYADIKLKQ